MLRPFATMMNEHWAGDGACVAAVWVGKFSYSFGGKQDIHVKIMSSRLRPPPQRRHQPAQTRRRKREGTYAVQRDASVLAQSQKHALPSGTIDTTLLFRH